jgi:hypothetical protein
MLGTPKRTDGNKGDYSRPQLCTFVYTPATARRDVQSVLNEEMTVDVAHYG